MVDAKTFKELTSHLTLEEKIECLQEIANLKISNENAEELYHILQIFEIGLDDNLAMQVRVVCKKLEAQYPNRFSFDFLNSTPVIEHLLRPLRPQMPNNGTDQTDLDSICPHCGHHVFRTLFCTWCGVFLANAQWIRPTKLQRIMALCLDLFLFFCAVYASISLHASAGMMMMTTFATWQAFLFNSGTTIGKWAYGLQIVTAKNGLQSTFIRTMFRETIGKIISAACVGLGFFWGLFDKNGRTWHDLLSGSVVVRQE